MLPEIKLKIKNTPYKKLKSQVANEKGVDYLFVNDSGGKERSISFKRESTSLTRQDFESQFKDNIFFTINDY